MGGKPISSRLFCEGFVQGLRQGIQQGGANVARHGHSLARACEQLPCQRGDGRFTVGTGDAQYLGVIGHAGLQITERLGKQGEFRADPQTCGHRSVPQGSDRLWAQAWALEHCTHILAFDQAGIKSTV